MNDYSDIINLPRPKAPNPLSRDARAAQFAPYAALTGHKDIIMNNELTAKQRIDIDRDIVVDFDE